MTKLAYRIATGIAILGLAAPTFAATTTKSTSPSAVATQTSVLHKANKHKKVAQAESKKSSKKVEKKGAVKSTKAQTPATPSATPAPASK